MGLYINHHNHDDIYKNISEIDEPNQGYFIRNHVAEMIKEQREINDSLHASFQGLKNRYVQQENNQSSRWREISSQLNELKSMNTQHEKLERHVMEQLKKLEEGHTRLDAIMKSDQLSKLEVMEQLNYMTGSQQAMAKQLDDYGSATEKLVQKMEKQTNFQNQMHEQLSTQENSQSEILDRLKNQEALTEKVVRQMEHFRSVLFERTSYLTEKIEEGYQLTSDYVNQFMTGSGQLPAKFIRVDKKKEEKSSK